VLRAWAYCNSSLPRDADWREIFTPGTSAVEILQTV
jgi:hypothetical protein